MVETRALVPVAELLSDLERAKLELTARFPQDLTTVPQVRQFVAIALQYGLDPFLGHLIPFQGRPYITEEGWWAKIHERAPGQLVLLEDWLVTKDGEYELRGLVPTKDYLAQARATRRFPNGTEFTLTASGIVFYRESQPSEREQAARRGRYIVEAPGEMALKRARRGVLERLFADLIQLPAVALVEEPLWGSEEEPPAPVAEAPASVSLGPLFR